MCGRAPPAGLPQHLSSSSPYGGSPYSSPALSEDEGASAPAGQQPRSRARSPQHSLGPNAASLASAMAGGPPPETPPVSRSEQSYYSEQDEKRLHEGDSRFWAHQPHAHAAMAPTHADEGAESADGPGAADDTGALADGLARSHLAGRNADLDRAADGTYVAPPHVAQLPSSAPPAASASPPVTPGSSSLAGPHGRFAASPAEAAAALAGMGAVATGAAGPSAAPASAPTANGPLPNATEELTSELRALYANLQRCAELRDKYMGVSLQANLADNPKNWDAEHCERESKRRGQRTEASKRADARDDTGTPEGSIVVDGAALDAKGQPKPWRIYPSPPRPHWELFHPPPASSFVSRPTSVNPLPPAQPPASPANATAAQALLESTGGKPGVFRSQDTQLPPVHTVQGREVHSGMDPSGVFQVWLSDPDFTPTDDVPHPTPIFKIPSIREYFRDLDFLLGVISDGPTKSFAWRRLKYLESKWNLYFLLNEYRELADMKRVPHR
jgi:AMP deaminase